VAQCSGLISEAACHAGHAILAARGEWVTNEKRLLTRAGLSGIDDIVTGLQADPSVLIGSVARARTLLDARMDRLIGLSALQ